MGILDDAIREHLELKRKHGAEGEDLERLENEAFGPATRPGDPEFPNAEPATGEEQLDDRADASDVGDGDDEMPDWFGDEGPTTVAPSVDVEPRIGAERARAERPALGDTADHPAPIQLGPEDEAEASPSAYPGDATSEGERGAGEGGAEVPPEPPESSIFDADDFEFDEIDLELEDDSPAAPEAPAVPGPAEESPAAPPPPSEQSAPILEPAVPPESDPAAAEAPPSEPPAAEPPAPAELGERSDPPVEGGTPEEGEDLLEETPDFLEDAPEGEDLWFEQGPPRDFDFDD